MTLETLLTHPAVQALGQALLHFLWQGSLLALLLWVIKTITPTSARIRYAAASLIMLAMPVSIVLTMAQDRPKAQPSVAATAPVPVIASAAPILAAMPVGVNVGITGWVVCIWIAGVLLLSLRATGGWMRAQRLKRRVLPASAALQDMMTRLKTRLRVSAPVRFYTSAMVQVPTVIGWVRPHLLLPVTALTGLSESQLEAILAHELAHIRRHDYLVNLLQTGIETVLFYHPAVWWVGKQMRIEREHCCDDIAVAVCGNAIEYAGALAELEQIRGKILEPALAATGGELLGRIRRLLGQQRSDDRASRSLGPITAAVLVLFMAGVPTVRSLNAAPQQVAQQAPPSLPKAPSPVAPESPKTQASERNRINDAFRADLNSVIEKVNRDVSEEEIFLEAQVDSPRQELLLDSERKPERVKTTDFLLKLFDDEKDLEMKLSIMGYLSRSTDPRAAEKLLTIVRSEGDLELRLSALGWIARKSNSFETLVSLFDSEKNMEMKLSILGWIERSNDPRAEDKLLSIVKSDPNIEVRRAALGRLAGR